MISWITNRRSFITRVIGALLLLVAVGSANAQLPLTDALPSLDLRNVARGTAAVNLPDGGAIVAGEFAFIGGDTPRFGLVKLRPDGSVDPNWRVTAQGVLALAVDGDRLYLAGSFSSVGGVSRRGLAQISVASGALATWDPNLGSTSTYRFEAIALNMGQAYVGGDFTQVGSSSRIDLAKVDSTSGTLDTTWNLATNAGQVYTLVSSSTHLFVGGSFTELGGLPRVRAAKISLSNGTIDATWQPTFTASDAVRVLAIDGTDLYAAGCFDVVNGAARRNYAKVSTEAAGALDAWNPAVVGGCNFALSVNASHVYLSGHRSVAVPPMPRLDRVNKTTGALDASFQAPQFGGTWNWGSLPRPNGNLLTWGEFHRIGGGYSAGLAELNASGALTSTPLWAEVRGVVNTVLPVADGIWVGGRFSRAGAPRSNLLKLNASGSLDTVVVDASGAINALAAANGQVYVGGSFSQIGNTPRLNLVRLDANGSTDSAWTVAANSQVDALKVSGADDLYVGGFFTQIGGQARNRIARVSRSTSTVSPWNPNADSRVRAVEVDGSGVYLGGSFTTIGGQTRNRLAKVDLTTGALDAAFAGDANLDVQALLSGPGNTLYVGGGFSTINGLGRVGFARLLSATGVPDSSWNAFTNSSVSALAPSADGLYVGGAFSAVGNQARTNLARVSHTGVVDPLFAPPLANFVLAVAEQGSRVLAGGSGISAPNNPTQNGILSFARTATPQATTLTITQDEPENSQPFQTYQVSVSLGAGALSVANQRIVVEDDFGATCTVFTNAAGTGTCELASRVAGTRQLTARYAGTPPLVPSSSDTEPHTVASTSTTPPVNTAFDLRAPTFVNVDRTTASVKLSDNSVVLGGTFTRIDNTPRRGLAKLLPDGTLDPNFSADVIGGSFGGVSHVLADANDNIYVIGRFGHIDGVLRRNIAKLDSSGNLVSDWTAAVSDIQLDNGGEALRPAIDSNGDLILQARIVTVAGSPNFYRTSLLKLSGTNGALIPSFAPTFTTLNTSFFPQLKIFPIGTNLIVLRGFDAVNGVARRNAVRLDSNGVVDSTWNPSPNAKPESAVDDGNGGVFLAGSFTEVAGQSASKYLVQLNADGSLNASFNAAVSNPDRTTVFNVIREGNTLWATGFFDQIGGLSRSGVAKLDANTGVADAAFSTSGTFNFMLPSMLKVGDRICGDIGDFDFDSNDVRAMGRLCRDVNTGARVPTVLVSRPAQVSALARQPDGATLIGGFFARFGSTQQGLVRITAAGVLDTSFNPPVGKGVYALHVRSNGDIYAAGNIFDGGNGLLKLNPSGSVDSAFQVITDGSFRSLLPSSDGLIVGGRFFTTINGVPRVGVAKLDYATGAVSLNWNPVLSGGFIDVAALASDNGAVFLGGSFTSVNGTPRTNLAKLNSDGSLDLSWQADANNSVTSIFVDGSDVYAGGFFSMVGGQTRRGIAKLAQSNGAVQSWNANALDVYTTVFPFVYAIAKTQEGGILAGGSFNRLGGAYRSNAVKLDPVTAQADPNWNPSFDGTVRAILAGYGGTPPIAPLRSVEQNIAIGGDFEFAGSVEMPGFTAVSSSGGGPVSERIFCSRFEDTGCAALP